MGEKVFWCFMGFGIITVLLALGGGFFALSKSGGAVSVAFGFLLIFMSASLALMLGSLLFIRKKEKIKNRDRENRGGIR